MNRRAFRRILHRYADGQSTPDERAVVEQWYALLENPDASSALPQTLADWQALETRLWHRVRPRPAVRYLGQRTAPESGRGRAWFVVRYGLVASVALLLGGAVWWVSRQASLAGSELVTRQDGMLQTVNRSAGTLRLCLADGSLVVLQPGSALHYPAQFETDKREVYLAGAAFFEVVKNPKQPFLVYANELVTKVLGTSFWVRAFAAEASVQVVVRTGRVSVFRQGTRAVTASQTPRTAAGHILTPNQQLVFNRSEISFNKSLVAEPLALQPVDFQFRNTPVSDALRVISQTYGIAILYDETLLARCPITATLTHESLYGKLDLICRAIGADYQVIDGQVVINTVGCDQ